MSGYTASEDPCVERGEDMGKCRCSCTEYDSDSESESRSDSKSGNVDIRININTEVESEIESKNDVRNSGYNDDNDNGNDNGNGEKVTLCHNGNTIEVAESAVQAHLDHGDTLGPCEEIIIADVKFIDTNDELEVDSDNSKAIVIED